MCCQMMSSEWIVNLASSEGGDGREKVGQERKVW